MPIKQFGKSSIDLKDLKQSYLQENETLIDYQRHTAKIYRQQVPRNNCKNCDNSLKLTDLDFMKDGIGYVYCDTCTHLNGIYDDTFEYCEAVYTDKSGELYSKNYKSDNVNEYNHKTASIYIPKATFMYTSLLGDNVNPNELSYLDYGAGSGYFVAALKKIGLKHVSGTDVSKSQVDFGNTMIGEDVLKVHNLIDSSIQFKNAQADVLSMIGVLEHLQEPRKALNNIVNNTNIKYLYLSIPTASLSMFIEIFSEDVFHRQLHGGHTHLYTNNSLKYMINEFGFQIVAEWWFGTDIVDLFRHMSVKMNMDNCSKRTIQIWKQNFVPIIDAMQLEIDKKQFSSEVHILLKKSK